MAHPETRPVLYLIQSPSGLVLSVCGSQAEARREGIEDGRGGCPIVRTLRQADGDYGDEEVVDHVPGHVDKPGLYPTGRRGR